MSQEKVGVLVLCTGNSARSVIAEYLFRSMGNGIIDSYSAGSQPTGKPNPFAIEVLAKNGIDASDARSKSWDEFSGDGAPNIDIVITVCDSAASESCPIWPGAPIKAHWGVADPAAVEGSDEDKRAAFAKTYEQMQARIAALLKLDFSVRDERFSAALREIGKMDDANV